MPAHHDPDQDRQNPLQRIFGAVNDRYDLINYFFTWGMDKTWRNALISDLLALHPQKVLDVGCGTGELSVGIALNAPEDMEITGYDFSKSMLDKAVRKAQERAPQKKIAFIHGEVARMPFPDALFDCITIAFALRNLLFQNPLAKTHLSEIYRTLKPGGNCLIVESSQPQNRLIRWFNHLYLRTCVYGIGAAISGNREAYRYLTQSAIHFHAPEALERQFLAVGFRQFFFRPLFFGAAGIFRVLK
ncbi:MAG: ubiquinone/menaquinone biosynthesis methyltransferase [Deltaproteobacteria bacterium]|nr:ubiquinone/menaquinone biosynthesis methyltransferase [Deltaproteobacteria bacterium]